MHRGTPRPVQGRNLNHPDYVDDGGLDGTDKSIIKQLQTGFYVRVAGTLEGSRHRRQINISYISLIKSFQEVPDHGQECRRGFVFDLDWKKYEAWNLIQPSSSDHEEEEYMPPPRPGFHVDHRDQPQILSKIRDQADYNRREICWAVTACAVVEAAYRLQILDFPDLAVQELIDKIPKKPGPWVATGLQYMMLHGGLRAEADYRRVGQSQKKYGRINSIEFIAPNDELRLMDALNNQPVAYVMELTNDFPNYKEGICFGWGKRIFPHALLLYGHTRMRPEVGIKDVNCYIAQNSYGEGWGESGFCYFPRPTSYPKTRLNALQVCYPVIMSQVDPAGKAKGKRTEGIIQEGETSKKSRFAQD